MRTIHLCAGIGCGMLADRVIGNEPVAAVEIDPFCCGILRDRAAEGWFPGLEVHECDLRTFDGRPYAGRVDCLCAGWPCQDISRMGSGEGLAGARSGLWSEVARIIGELRCQRVWLENSPVIVDRGLERVLADLARLGYDARWGVVAAAHTGASHGRDRWWCMADAVRVGLQGVEPGGAATRPALGGGRDVQAVADADAAGQRGEPTPGVHGGGACILARR